MTRSVGNTAIPVRGLLPGGATWRSGGRTVHQPHPGVARCARGLPRVSHPALRRVFAVQPGGAHGAARVGREAWLWAVRPRARRTLCRGAPPRGGKLLPPCLPSPRQDPHRHIYFLRSAAARPSRTRLVQYMRKHPHRNQRAQHWHTLLSACRDATGLRRRSPPSTGMPPGATTGPVACAVPQVVRSAGEVQWHRVGTHGGGCWSWWA